MKRNLLFLFVAFLPMLASAYDAEIDGIYYNFNTNARTATVTSGSTKYSGTVAIPESVIYSGQTYSVTTIDDNAFYNCTKLSFITIPNSVTSIGSSAFSLCGLTSITIPANVTTIGERAFEGCSKITTIAVEEGNEVYDSRESCNAIIETTSNTLILGCKNTIIPATVTTIGEWAFSRCYNLTSITIPENVTSIGEYAFWYCYGLTSITIPEGMTTISDYAFDGCRGLTSITISASVTSIGDHALCLTGGNRVASIVVEEGNAVYDSRESCNAIIETASNTLILGCENTIIPESVTSIGSLAFYECSSLTSISIPNNVTCIGSSAFYNCSSLTSIIIPNEVSTIGEFAFANTKWMDNQPDGLVYAGKVAYTYKGTMLNNTTIDIKEGTLGIAGYAFSNCSGLTSITIPNSVTNIGRETFYGCNGLKSITIPTYVTSIGDYAFYNCSGLTSIKANMINPISVTSETFWNCMNATLYVPQGCKAAYQVKDVWKDFKEIIELSADGSPNIIFADANVKAICVTNWDTNSDGELSYAEAAAVTDLGEVFQSNQTITSFDELRYFTSLESISNSAFGGCSGLTSITIGNSVTSIGDYAFWDCSGLTSITIPRSVVSIGYIAFRGCTGLYSINVEAGNTKYDSHDNSNAIIETESNTLITGCLNTIIPNNVTSIGESAFDGCTGLTSITIPNSVTSIGSSAFHGCSGLTSIEFSNNVISIGSSAFYGCSGLTNITIPNSVTYIGSAAFKNSGWYDAQSDGILYLDNWLICYKGSKPTGTITIKNETKGLACYAFYGSYDLTSITIPNSVIFIGDGVFTGCSKLTSITIPNGVTSIGNCLYSDCFGLTSISIPNSVTSISNQAFENCRSLTSITIPNGVTSIGYQAFTNCSGLTSITIPNHVTSIGFWAFNGCSGLTSFEIPNSVTSIGDSAFGNCYFATSNFVNNSSLTSSDTWGATLCDEETSDGLLIKNNSVIKCRPWVTSATIPNSVISIGSNAFQTCSALTSITIPNSVTTIGNRAFIGCSDLSSVISKIEEPFVFGSSAFFNISNNCVLKVPVGTRDAYIAAGWTEDVFKGGVVEMPEEDTDISGMDNVIYIEPTEGREGDIVSLEVKLKNSITPVGCSFKLKLPEGFSLVKDSDGDVIYELSDRTKKMSVTMQDWNNGSYDFALTPSTGTATISGNDGSIVTLRIQVPEEVAPGDYKIKLTNNLIQSKVSGTTQDNALPDVKTTFTVEDYIMGDVNGDKNVTPADAIMILYHYFNVEQNGFIVKAADLNKDGNITPADAIEALYLYFGVGNSNAVRSFIETLDPQ